MKALVTGASSGIGKEIAYYLSSLGYDLFIVARNKDSLVEVEKNVKTNAKIIVKDLTHEKDVYSLYEMLKNEDLDIVVNNAGFGLFGLFSKTDLDPELEMIDLNIRAYHILTKKFLQDFIKKDKGYILNVCSSAGFMAGPRLSTYYATKNYITKLSMAINEEMRQMKCNVHVCALCPGPVATNFNNVAKGEFSLKEADPVYVAKYGVDKMLQGKMIIVPTLRMKLGLFFLRFVPYRIQLIFAYHIQWRKENGKK